MENYLMLKDFSFAKTEVDEKKIRKFSSNSDFMNLMIELFKEVIQISSILACSCQFDGRNYPRKWQRNEAIIGGLMVRISKLQISLLGQICEKRMEIVDILLRCIGESIINLMYLLKHYHENEIFNEFIEYSLRTEKRLLNQINQNIHDRGQEMPIEKRMKKSIYASFEKASFDIEKVNESSWGAWGEKGYKKAKEMGITDKYFALCSMPSHAVHGNFQDLIRFHLKHNNGEFEPNTNWGTPGPQIISGISLVSLDLCKEYIEIFLPAYNEKGQILSLMDDIALRVKIVDELHEQYLINTKKTD